jgi:hypothetical protein
MIVARIAALSGVALTGKEFAGSAQEAAPKAKAV